jgi:hypothetical protein
MAKSHILMLPSPMMVVVINSIAKVIPTKHKTSACCGGGMLT